MSYINQTNATPHQQVDYAQCSATAKSVVAMVPKIDGLISAL